MNAIALDRNALNGLFDNQKKLDDLFDSIFDDDNFYISSTPVSVQSVARSPEFKVERSVAYKSSSLIKSVDAMKQHPYFFVLPILLELTVIYWLITHLL